MSNKYGHKIIDELEHPLCVGMFQRDRSDVATVALGKMHAQHDHNMQSDHGLVGRFSTLARVLWSGCILVHVVLLL